MRISKILALLFAVFTLGAAEAFAQLSVQKVCAPDVFANDSVSETITVHNTGASALTNVTISDDDGGDMLIAELAAGGSFTWAVTASTPDPGVFSSTAIASAGGFTASATCSVHVWDLKVTKTAQTSFTRDWRWTLTKTANTPGPVTIPHGSFDTIGFVVAATPAAVDSNWTISGTVKVHNPAPIAATVTSVSDVLSALSCGGSGPFTIAAGGDLNCSYSTARPNGSSGTNTATATLRNNNGGSTTFDGSVSYAFSIPTTVLHQFATVTDLGVTSDVTGWSFSNAPASFLYAAPRGGSFVYNTTAGNASAQCDTYSTATNRAQLSDGDRIVTASASTQLYSGVCPSNGCTLSAGFWKTHAGFTGRNADRVTAALPQWLGTSGGAKSVKVTNASQAVNLLSNSGEASNGVNKLYAQLLAAKLNIFRGASPSAISATLAAADAFLATNNSADWQGMTKNTKTQVNNWMSTFDQYNEGVIGPGHCE